MLFGAIQSRSHSLRDTRPFLFGDRSENRDDRILKRATRVEIRLGVGSKAYAVAAQLAQILECFEGTLASKTV